MNLKKQRGAMSCIALILFSSCATIMHGTEQRVRINSDPPGVKVKFDNGLTLTTPGEVVLKRNRDYFVEFERPGEDYNVKIKSSLSGWFFGNFIFLWGWWIGMIVDAADGAMWKLEPEEVNVSFEPTTQEPQSVSSSGIYIPPQIPLPEYSGEKISIAVLNLNKGVGLSEELTGFIVDHIKSTLVHSGVFKVVEKEDVQKYLIANVSKLDEKFFINLQLTDRKSDVIESTAEEQCYCKLEELPIAAEVATKRLIVNFLKTK